MTKGIITILKYVYAFNYINIYSNNNNSKRVRFGDTRISSELTDMWIPLLEALSEKYDEFGIGLMPAMLKRLESQDGNAVISRA